jgi:hypothetical protein
MSSCCLLQCYCFCCFCCFCYKSQCGTMLGDDFAACVQVPPLPLVTMHNTPPTTAEPRYHSHHVLFSVSPRPTRCYSRPGPFVRTGVPR